MSQQTFSAMWSDQLCEAIKQASTEPYRMELVGDDVESVRNAINQGIDAHLEAIMFSQFKAGHKLGLCIEPQTLHVLVRRLMESDGDNSLSLASSICETLNIELV